MTYARARKDFEFLQTLAELNDQVELDAERQCLMENPTKRYAMGMYESAIRLWFHEHGSQCGALDNRMVRAIAERHNIDQ